MGFTKLDDIIGRADLLEFKPRPDHWKAKHLDMSKILYVPKGHDNSIRNVKKQHHKIDNVLDRELITLATPALEFKEKVDIVKEISNTDRTTGAMLAGEVAKRYGGAGLPDNTINATFRGSAGQSFGAFLTKGMTFRLVGDANDYLGKGLSGGKIIVVPPKDSILKPEENIIVGNTLMYGATSGEVYINGVAGERFCVRNSGAIAVIEGAGDHCCEYMTGGRAVILGPVGRNFAAGMSGGLAYVLNEDGNFDFFCNMGMVELSLVDDMSDNKELKDLISRHYHYTSSPLAQRILENWNEYITKFIRVVPIEYKKVLEEEKIEALKQKIEKVEYDY
jgi:glutamate synthase (NADPH/NADH) large chain